MLRRLGLALLIGSLLGSAGRAQVAAKYDGQYVGELTLTKIINGDCTKPPLGALYPLTISQGQVRFEYRPHFGTMLTGKIVQNGFFEASARLRGGFVHMTGYVHGNNITAFIASPSCRYTFQTMN